MDPWIQTYSGRAFDLLDPQPEQIDIEDIAHALAHICRYTGHTEKFYSVAQHSILAATHLPAHLRRWGLLHDAAEAYLGDVSAPLKRLLPRYQEIERNVERVVWAALGLEGELPDEVKQVDLSLLMAEKRDLLGPEPRPWGIEATGLDRVIVPWSSGVAEYVFLECYWSEQRRSHG